MAEAVVRQRSAGLWLLPTCLGLLCALGVLVVVVVAVPAPNIDATAGRSRTPNAATVQYIEPFPGLVVPKRTRSTEAVLATIDAWVDVQESDARVAAYRDALRRLNSYYQDSAEVIAEDTIGVLTVLKNHDIKTDMLAILNGMEDVGSLRKKGASYRRDLFGYAVLRVDGRTHVEAVGALRDDAFALGN